MGYIGGDFTEVTYNHPTLGSGSFSPKAGEDSTKDNGGFRGNDDANSVTGNGRRIKQLNRVGWFVELVIAVDDQEEETMDVLSAMAGDPEDADWTFTHVSGVVYVGKGSPVGDIQDNKNAATSTLKVAGGGILEKV